MIDTEKKIIYFGYGDVQVGTGYGSTITFTGFKPPIEVGSIISNEVVKDKSIEYITEPIKINFGTVEELMCFKKLVQKIDGTHNACFGYRDYVFDFSNYNQISIKVILKHIEDVKRYFIRLMAC